MHGSGLKQSVEMAHEAEEDAMPAPSRRVLSLFGSPNYSVLGAVITIQCLLILVHFDQRHDLTRTQSLWSRRG